MSLYHQTSPMSGNRRPNKLQFLYQGSRLVPIISLTDAQRDDKNLVNDELRDYFLQVKELPPDQQMVEYEIGQYEETAQSSPLSGATIEEASRAVEYLANFYDDQLVLTQKSRLERQFRLSNDRLKRIVLLLADLVGAELLLSFWISLLAKQLQGVTRKEASDILGEPLELTGSKAKEVISGL